MNSKSTTITHINNWCCFGTRSVMIILNKSQYDNEIIYQPSLSICLDDGAELPESYEQELNIDILLDIYYGCPYCAAREAANSIVTLFNSISDSVLILDQDGTIRDDETISLTELFKKSEEIHKHISSDIIKIID